MIIIKLGHMKKSQGFVPVFLIAVVIVASLAGVVYVSFKFNSPSKKADDKTTTVKTASGLVRAIDKDSIFESKNGGLDFEPHFKIITNNEIGQADVLSVAFHPTKQDDTVVGSLQDGLFRRSKGEEGWTPIVFPPKNIFSFILDKSDPDNRMFASGVISENGRIFRSVDGGENWRAVYTEPGLGTVVTSLAQHHTNTNVIFAGTSAGTVIKSVDGGESWKNLGNKIDGMIKDINFDAKNQNSIYLLSHKSKVYYSRDGGLTWIDWEEEKMKSNSLSAWNSPTKMPDQPLFLVADPNISGTVYISAARGLFRSTDYGKNWKEVNIIESAKSLPILSIAINPMNSKEIVFIAGTSFYKSINNGDTWSVTPLSSQRNASFIIYDPFDSQHIMIGVNGGGASAQKSLFGL
jgi:photosystem II stability/assembly factor-like uncharacterized protein